jgi:hypothetical protein
VSDVPLFERGNGVTKQTSGVGGGRSLLVSGCPCRTRVRVKVLVSVRCRANMAHTTQSSPGFQVKVLKLC